MCRPWPVGEGVMCVNIMVLTYYLFSTIHALKNYALETTFILQKQTKKGRSDRSKNTLQNNTDLTIPSGDNMWFSSKRRDYLWSPLTRRTVPNTSISVASPKPSLFYPPPSFVFGLCLHRLCKYVSLHYMFPCASMPSVCVLFKVRLCGLL